MNISAEQIRKLGTELKYVVQALLCGDTVWMWNGSGTGVDSGWVKTTCINVFLDAKDYCIQEEEPTHIPE